MSKTQFMCALAVLIACAGSTNAAWMTLDDFNREDGTINTHWTQHLYTAGDANFVIDGFDATTDGQAKSKGEYKALMTFNDHYDQNIRFDVHHSGGTGTESTSAILAFDDIDNYLAIQISSNAGLDTFHSIIFLHMKDGTLNYGWTNIDPPGYFEYLGTDSFTDAQITASLKKVGMDDVVRIEIDMDFNDATAPELVFERGGVPVADLGSAVGLAAYGEAKIDDFEGVPEPYTVALLAIGGMAMLRTGRRGRGKHITS